MSCYHWLKLLRLSAFLITCAIYQHPGHLKGISNAENRGTTLKIANSGFSLDFIISLWKQVFIFRENIFSALLHSVYIFRRMSLSIFSGWNSQTKSGYISVKGSLGEVSYSTKWPLRFLPRINSIYFMRGEWKQINVLYNNSFYSTVNKYLRFHYLLGIVWYQNIMEMR